jgi:hypothetical protein
LSSLHGRITAVHVVLDVVVDEVENQIDIEKREKDAPLSEHNQRPDNEENYKSREIRR